MKDSPLYIPGERVFDPKFERKPAGFVIVNGQEVAHTLQCAHCSAHFISVRGSGKRRGFCWKCMKVLCGKLSCMTCKPYLEGKT